MLVLSRFAGAAHELIDALLVNLFDTVQVVEAMRQALTMPLVERKRRWQRMIEHLRTHDITAWRTAFLQALRNCTPRSAAQEAAAFEPIRLGNM